METYTLIIKQDGELKKKFTGQKSDFEAFKYLLNHQGQSTDWALKYGGWSVEIVNEQTKESAFYKPYSA